MDINQGNASDHQKLIYTGMQLLKDNKLKNLNQDINQMTFFPRVLGLNEFALAGLAHCRAQTASSIAGFMTPLWELHSIVEDRIKDLQSVSTKSSGKQDELPSSIIGRYICLSCNQNSNYLKIWGQISRC
jgi:hypothetical protein